MSKVSNGSDPEPPSARGSAPERADFPPPIQYRPASALTNTLIDFGSIGATVVVGVHPPVVEHTVSFSRTHFDTAMQLLSAVKANGSTSPDRLQPILVSLNLGLSALFGGFWSAADSEAYARERGRLFAERLGSSPNKDQIRAFDLECPKLDRDRTFALSTFVRAGFPLAKGWNLQVEHSDLYAGLMRLFNYVKDKVEHTESFKLDSAVLLSLEEVEAHLLCVRRVAAWLLTKHYGGNMPTHARLQYVQVFGVQPGE
jgi:hypothetical protein